MADFKLLIVDDEPSTACFEREVTRSAGRSVGVFSDLQSHSDRGEKAYGFVTHSCG